MSNSIKREQHDEVVTIIFDQENSSANVFNENMFVELDEQLTFIENNQKEYEKLIDLAADEISNFVDKASLENLS